MTEMTEIYASAYAAEYPALYTDDPFWAPKHDANRRVLAALLGARWCRAWLDVCCGQAPFFGQAPARVTCTGLDRSAAQLAGARARHPGAELVEADVRAPDVLAGRRFSLVTSFWGAYSYLGSQGAVASMLRRMVTWLDRPGALYVEVIDPARLAGFNATSFARAHGFEVEVIDAAQGRWRYRDSGGAHELCSPPPERFTQLLRAQGLAVERVGDVQTMVQLVAWRR